MAFRLRQVPWIICRNVSAPLGVDNKKKVNGNRLGRNHFPSRLICSWSSALSFTSLVSQIASYLSRSVPTNSSSRMNQIVFVLSASLWLQITIKGQAGLHLIKTLQSDMCECAADIEQFPLVMSKRPLQPLTQSELLRPSQSLEKVAFESSPGSIRIEQGIRLSY